MSKNTETQAPSLIDKNNRKPDELVHLSPSEINPSRTGNPRDKIADADYNNLKASIQAYNGIHTPIAVWIVDGEPELIYGNTRTKICIELGIKSIPVLIKDVKTQDEADQLALSENIDRNKMTLLQEAKGLKKVVAQCSGDITAAVSVMGWSESKFKKALQLLKATAKVQSLIGIKQVNGFTLSEGHAAQLSLIPSKIQDRLVDAIIHEKMTINQLSSQLKKSISLPLATAVFCKKECESCSYNSNQQAALLPSLGFDDDVCGNPICFKEKTEEHYQTKMLEMKEEHGKVVLKSTISVAMEVTAELVGEDQLSQCRRCDMHCAILNDKTEIGQGQIKESQCINPTCLQSKMKALILSNKKSKAPVTEMAAQSSTPTPKDTDKKEKAENKTTSCAKEVNIPNRCKVEAQKIIRKMAAKALKAHPHYALALTVASLESTLNKGCVTTNINRLINKKMEELELLREKALEQITNTHQNTMFNMERAVIQCARENTNNFQLKAIKSWVPNESNLSNMTKQIRIITLEDSGFTKAFKSAFSEKEYIALLAKKSDEQVADILKFEFDWTHYAPSFFIESINKPYYQI